MAMKSFMALIALVFLALPAAAAEPMAFPLVCAPGESCWIIGYPDLNPAPGIAQDYACGPAAADGDVFMRIGLASVAAIPQNIPVLAADDGVVLDASNGIADRVVSSRKQLSSNTSNCGNGIVIKHALGVQTAYCHLKQNSLRVRKGDRVMRGQIIASAGQSGVALWPQLGFSIISGGFFEDPITGKTTAEGCGAKGHAEIALPDQFKDYQPVAIVDMGFANGHQNAADMAIGRAQRLAYLSAEEKTMNLWALVLGVHKGDEIETRLRDPRGRSFHYQSLIADEDLERMPVNIKRDRGFVGWRTGGYTGEIKITRTVNNRPYAVERQVTMIVR